jgi:hypothetical protein
MVALASCVPLNIAGMQVPTSTERKSNMKRKLATNPGGVAVPVCALKLGIQAHVADHQHRASDSMVSPAEDPLSLEVPVAVCTAWMGWWLYFCFE